MFWLKKQPSCWKIPLILLFILSYPFHCPQVMAEEIIFQDSLDDWGDWSSDKGVWDIGTPTSGPGAPFEGSGLAGTLLNGDYPPDSESHLISPTITLPPLNHPWEQLILSVNNWYAYFPTTYPDDYAQLKIRTYNSSGSWSSWAKLGDPFKGSSDGWRVLKWNLNRYAGVKVQIGFYHKAGPTADDDGEAAGWYIDDLNIAKVVDPFYMPEGFEGGWQGWYAQQDIWEIGTPTTGPNACHSGANCVGTVMGGDYHPDIDSMLVSPPITLPEIAEGDEIKLIFWHWFAYESRDKGEVYVRSWNENSHYWNSWYRIETFQGESSTWTRSSLQINNYADNTIQIGFNHYADSYNGDGEKAGWYIDEVEVSIPGDFAPLIKSFTTDKTYGVIPLNVAFTVDADDLDGAVTYFQWDWDGDGIIDSEDNASTASHTYETPSIAFPAVTVVDDTGNQTFFNGPMITADDNANIHIKDQFEAGDFIADVGYGDLDEDRVQLQGDTASISLGEGDSGESLLLYQWTFDIDPATAPVSLFIRHKAEQYLNETYSFYTLNLILNPTDELDFWDDPILRQSSGVLNQELENFIVAYGPHSSYGGKIGVDYRCEGYGIKSASKPFPDSEEWVDTRIVIGPKGFYVFNTGEHGFSRESFFEYDTSGIHSIALGIGDQQSTYALIDRVEVRGMTGERKMRESKWAATPTALEFGSVVKNTSSPMAILIENTGTSKIGITSARISGADAEAFSLEGEIDPTLALEPDETFHLVLLFQPVEARTYDAQLTLLSDAGEMEVKLTGTGIAEAIGSERAYSVIVANSKSMDVHILDPTSNKVQGGFLFGHLGRYELNDLAVTPDGKRVLISSPYSGIFMLDVANPIVPKVINQFNFESFSEADVDISPNGRFAIVASENRNNIGVLDLRAEAMVAEYDLEELLFSGAKCAAVAIAPDGQTVLLADYSQSRVYILLLNALGGLSYRGISLETGRNPVNIAIAPDGKTAIVVAYSDTITSVLKIDAPGEVTKGSDVELPYRRNAAAVFTPDSRRAYIFTAEASPDELYILDVLGPGSLRLADHSISLTTDATGTYYGVDSIAISPDGSKAYLTNAYDGGNVINKITIVDLNADILLEEKTVGEIPAGIGILYGTAEGEEDNAFPTCTITTDKTGGYPPLTVNFTARAEDSDGTIQSYQWDFGDETTGTGKSTSHTYSDSGQFTVMLTVSDDKGGLGSDAILIRVGQEEAISLRVTPANATLTIGSEIVLGIVGGAPPYNISATIGQVVPTHIETQGETVTYTADQLGEDYVTVTDKSGQDVKVRIRVTDQLGITPQEVNTGQSGTAEFRAVGGSPPYQWLTSGGQISRTQGSFNLYYAPDGLGEYQVTVRDNTGMEVTATVNVIADEIVLSPAVVTYIQEDVAEGIDFNITGGTKPYDWRATSGSVRPVGDGNQATYYAPEKTGTYYVTVTDSGGRSTQAVIRVVARLKVTPTELVVDRTETTTMQVTGGFGPFLWNVSNGDLSTVSGSTVTWIAPEIAGEHELTVTDAFGIEAKVKAVVKGGLMISPVLTVAGIDETVSLRAISGTPPYTWPDSTSEAVYTTTFSRLGRHEVIVKDASGASALAVVEIISDSVHIVPEKSDVTPNATQSLKVIGGMGPYKWTFDGGVLSATEGTTVTWVAPAKPGNFHILVEDSTGLKGGATLTVPGALSNGNGAMVDVIIKSKIQINKTFENRTAYMVNNDDDLDIGFSVQVPPNAEGIVYLGCVVDIPGSTPLIIFQSEQGLIFYDGTSPIPAFRQVAASTQTTIDVPFYTGKLTGFIGRMTFYVGWFQDDGFYMNGASPFVIELQ